MSRMSGAAAAWAWAVAGALAEGPLRLMLARRVKAGKEIAARLPERRGIETSPRPPGRLLWMHAASVGETISVLPVLDSLARLAPDLHLLLTTGTVTSAGLAAERLPQRALHRFVPLDVPRWTGRFLDHWQPDVACFVESEIWPNMLAAAKSRAIPVALLNGRLSAGSFRGWQMLRGLARRLFGGFALIWARSASDAERLRGLGGLKVAEQGDLKFAAPALPAADASLAEMRERLGGRPVWVAASIHPGEDRVVTAAHRLLLGRHPGLVTVIAPRHPARAGAMQAAFPMARRSLGQGLPQGGIYLADTLGELGLFYRLSACVFVGGSLVPHGGQNPLEAARLARPVAMGPHTGNFIEACAVLQAAGALSRVTDAEELAEWVHRLLADPAVCAQAGEAGRIAANRWADLPDRAARALLGLLPSAQGGN